MRKAAIKRAFRQVFFAILFLTLLSGGTSLCLASQQKLSPQQSRILDIASISWQIGLEAVFELAIIKVTHIAIHSSSKL
ncbi:hypothetical protein NIES4071_58550 [Calothrix sp. NIES-4071]|nr:hypothetical protein NIES4071_58550 [Calothrix sp. NIES-4071]BAZ60162.1 hypothetical protein NIES4105_58500 [Calothrix sp. NIES-4105]